MSAVGDLNVTHAMAGTRRVDLEGTVTVGPETAARLGVPVGTEIPLGVLASTDPNVEQGVVHEKAHMLRGEA